MESRARLQVVPGADPAKVREVSIVVPVYQGEKTLERLLAEIEPLHQLQRTSNGTSYRVREVVLVDDGSPDGSSEVMRSLAERLPFVRPVWLSRNFGQHAATLAGMASTTSEWIVTLDEDGQQNPADIARMLDAAIDTGLPLVYAQPLNPPPHGTLRNAFSSAAKWVFRFALKNQSLGRFNSFRLVRGDLGRSLAAYCGTNVYLDVALSWVAPKAAHCPLTLRDEGSARKSGYNWLRLGDHFLRLILTSGKRPLRFIALTGFLALMASIGIGFYALAQKFMGGVPVQGWTSLTVLICFFSGAMLFSLGVIAEYLGSVLTMTMGQPLYLVVSEPGRTKPK